MFTLTLQVYKKSIRKIAKPQKLNVSKFSSRLGTNTKIDLSIVLNLSNCSILNNSFSVQKDPNSKSR